MEIYEYEGFSGPRARCGLEGYPRPGGMLLVLTEMPDNPGTSITNMAEALVTRICRERDISPHGLVVVEHYPVRGKHLQYPETYDLIRFGFNWRTASFTSPKWERISPDAFEALVAESFEVKA